MCPNIVISCLVLLFVVSSSESQGNSTNGDQRNDNSMVRYDLPITFGEYRNDEIEPIQCNSCQNFIKINDNDDTMRYKSHRHIIKNREEHYEISTESHTNFTKINESMLEESNENLTNTERESYSNLTDEFYNSTILYSNTPNPDDCINNVSIVQYEMCENITCIQLCCPFGNKLTRKGKCVPAQNTYPFPGIYADTSEHRRLNKLFHFAVHDPCIEQGLGHYTLNGYIYIFNGSVFDVCLGEVHLHTSYCIAVMDYNVYEVIICTKQTKIPIYISACLLISLPFLLLTFVVYSILPELRNMHGYILRTHVGSLFIAYAIMYFGQQMDELAKWKFCVPLVYIFNFSFLASFFWLNVSFFDIWWTFRGFRSYQTNLKKDDRKKFIIYSLYVWGITFLINIICVIMDYVPGLPENVIRPEMCVTKFWFNADDAKTLYFYVPMGITVISNIYFFISTTRTILYQNIHTVQRRDSENKCHTENTQRFQMYLKLFIVMGITWIMELISWSINLNLVPPIVWYPTATINSLQGVIIFFIFVCTKKIKQLLLKRYGGRNCGPFCKIPMYTDNTATASTSSTSASGMTVQQVRHSN